MCYGQPIAKLSEEANVTYNNLPTPPVFYKLVLRAHIVQLFSVAVQHRFSLDLPRRRVDDEVGVSTVISNDHVAHRLEIILHHNIR